VPTKCPPAPPHLHFIDVGGVVSLAAAVHRALAAAVGHQAALSLAGADPRAVAPVPRAVAPAALELGCEKKGGYN